MTPPVLLCQESENNSEQQRWRIFSLHDCVTNDSSASSEDSTESTVAAREHRREKRKTIQALEKRLMKSARKHTPE